MSADGLAITVAPRAPSRRGRLLRLGFAALCAGTLWFVLATSAAAEDPTPGPGESPAAPAATAPPVPSPIPHPSVSGEDQCFACHVAVNDRQSEIAKAWEGSVHGQAQISCADCHGGDPRSDQITVAMASEQGFVGAPGRAETVGLCGSCHADVERMKPYGIPTDQYAKYWSSVHGQRLATAADARVAICTDCHGSHDVKKASDPTAKTYPLNVTDLCASCHADADRMKPYGIPTDQLAVYSESVHGVALLQNQDVRAPSCVSCHGSHDAKPPRATEVVDVCGKCHTATQELYEQSRHSQLSEAAPKCWTCHGTHDVSQPGSRLFFHPEKPDYECVTCHDLQTRQLRIELDRFQEETDRRCDTCHHEDSFIYSQVRGIADALGDAQDAFASAEGRIDEASRLGMITAEAEVGLTQARTSLIQAEAAVHTTKLTVIAGLASEAEAKAGDALILAQAQVDESVFRRQAMIVIVVVIFLNVLFLYALKRRLDRDLEAPESR